LRAYERSHVWLKFKADLGDVPPSVWMLLGEARSKCEHIAGVPLKPEVAKRLLQVVLARGVQGTTAIEGNTLTQEQVEALVAGQKPEVPASKAYQVQEVKNVIEALNGVVLPELAEGRLSALTPERVKQFNATVLTGLSLDEGVVPGEIRTYSVGVLRYRGAPAEDCGYLLEQMCDWLNGPAFDATADPQLKVPVAILKAILAHIYLAWIHPFGDGNGRTARLVEVQILATAGLPHVACHVLGNHYNQTRAEYYRQLERASASGGDVIPFIEYALRGLVDGLSEQLTVVRGQQLDVAWREHVYDKLRSRRGETGRRMRELILDLSASAVPVPKNDLPRLSPGLAVAYSTKTDKTLSRDLNALETLDLLVRDPSGYRARKERILAFLPLRNRKREGT
jgi:Fic family protein